MGSEPRVHPGPELIHSPVLQKFKLYSTLSNFYLVGRDEKKTVRRILKIDRTEPNELNLFEDPTNYSKDEWLDLKRRIDRGNKKYGGIEEVTTCYGIIGFVRFLEPYYMLVITKRKKMGAICGHTVYGIMESRMITIPNHNVLSEVAESLAENRYKKLLSMVNLRKDFYFSYTYNLMYSLQKNICNSERGKVHYNTLFVWNSFLTRRIRRVLQNTMWTVALVYGFFNQTICAIYGTEFVLTVIARRSRHFAGTRYLRRGVNEMGRVANDVETEQIISRNVLEGQRVAISSVVQNRGSIPLFWSQETSLFIPQPEIELYKKERNYEATKHHFENLKQRYGDPIIILNLIKASEKKRRETILRAEFAKAILFINRSLRKENRLRPIHFDLSKHFKTGAASAFKCLCIFATKALDLTNIFCCEASTSVGSEGVPNDSGFRNSGDGFTHSLPDQDGEVINAENETFMPNISILQTGILRTNCIDCLDRTNFAQYALGLMALRRQLHALGITASSTIDLSSPPATTLMEIYQTMGDTLALQYGGSEAHNKMFCDLRGEWNLVNKHRDIFIALRRHYSNAYLDSQKQNAINMPIIRRSFSDNIIWDGDFNIEEAVNRDPQSSRDGLNGGISESNPDFPVFENEASSLSFLSAICCEHHLRDTDPNRMFPGNCPCFAEGRDDNCAFANSCKNRYSLVENSFEKSSSLSWSSDNIYTDMENESITSSSITNSTVEFRPGHVRREEEEGEDDVMVPGFSQEFTQWVRHGRVL
ncbi:PREDICTED: phosphoinositide phosphatase SAC5-like isoform X2 [Tarenaya hassleriana]|uniref:phosphoinositide phosphatase SAC5-like isoform X2 n=1 Tax=Tarenaya hassleriana TaxID=28532 RepID=UPI00053C3DC4|nr:PREDICTED: phosphoinositide phosphatase SAC5-like isoform X2 [Tarenaya hassleriana]